MAKKNKNKNANKKTAGENANDLVDEILDSTPSDSQEPDADVSVIDDKVISVEEVEENNTDPDSESEDKETTSVEIKGLRVRNKPLAGRVLKGSVMVGDEVQLFAVQLDHNGFSGPVMNEDVYRKLIETGCEAASVDEFNEFVEKAKEVKKVIDTKKSSGKLRVRNKDMAGRTLKGSIADGDEQKPFAVTLDANGFSEAIIDERVYRKLIDTGCVAA